jgi:hypothetical protein
LGFCQFTVKYQHIAVKTHLSGGGRTGKKCGLIAIPYPWNLILGRYWAAVNGYRHGYRQCDSALPSVKA